MKIYPQVLTFFIKPKTWLFHVVVLLTTATKWTKVKNARAGRAKLLFLPSEYANLWRSRCRRRCRCLSSLLTRRCLAEDIKEMYQNVIHTCRAAVSARRVSGFGEWDLPDHARLCSSHYWDPLHEVPHELYSTAVSTATGTPRHRHHRHDALRSPNSHPPLQTKSYLFIYEITKIVCPLFDWSIAVFRWKYVNTVVISHEFGLVVCCQTRVLIGW